jgi:hypothetical protein
VVARAVVAGDAGPIEHEDDRAPVQPDIEVGLIEGPAEEGRVDGDDRADAGHAHAGGRGDLVLLGDAHIEEAGREAGLEGQQSGRTGHGRGHGHDAWVLFGRPEDGAGEGVRVGGGASRRPVHLNVGGRPGRSHPTSIGAGGVADRRPG